MNGALLWRVHFLTLAIAESLPPKSARSTASWSPIVPMLELPSLTAPSASAAFTPWSYLRS